MSDFRLGVAVICHSYPQHAAEALWSVQEQTKTPWDGVIVLDCPEQDKMESYSKIVAGFAGWNTIVHVKNRGVSAARNTAIEGLKKCGCNWYICLDEDDVLNRRCIERVYQAHQAASQIGGWYWDFVIFGHERNYFRAPEYDLQRLVASPFIMSAAAVRIAVWEQVKEHNGTGYDVELTEQGLRWEDYLFYLEAALLGTQFGRIGAGALLRARRHEESGTSVANQTQDQWKEYAARKLEALYGGGPLEL